MSSPMIKSLGKVAATLATAGIVLFVSVGGVLAGGNNGTLKVHELNTPAGTENNDPKVCSFNLEAFGLDAGQGGYLLFEVQGGDGPHGTDPGVKFEMPAADGSGFSTSKDDFNPSDHAGAFISNGHYKVTLYGKSTPSGQLSDVKAKSKVFKVTCNRSE